VQGCSGTGKREVCRGKILVRNPEIHGWISGSMFSAMQIQICQKNPKKNRHIEHYRCCARLDVAAQESENFAEQNSRQESKNPGMDFRFLKLRKSLCSKNFAQPWSSGVSQPLD